MIVRPPPEPIRGIGIRIPLRFFRTSFEGSLCPGKTSELFTGQFFLERIFPGSRIVSDIFKSSSDKTERAPRT